MRQQHGTDPPAVVNPVPFAASGKLAQLAHAESVAPTLKTPAAVAAKSATKDVREVDRVHGTDCDDAGAGENERGQLQQERDRVETPPPQLPVAQDQVGREDEEADEAEQERDEPHHDAAAERARVEVGLTHCLGTVPSAA